LQLTGGHAEVKLHLTKFGTCNHGNEETKKLKNGYLDFKEITMNKKLIFGLALALVLVSGSMFSANADCYFGCLPHISLPTCFTCARAVEPVRDRDCNGALITPYDMGSVSGGW
jgi:hypothetical protein